MHEGQQRLHLRKSRVDAQRLLEQIGAFEKELAENSRPAAFVEKAVPLSKK